MSRFSPPARARDRASWHPVSVIPDTAPDAPQVPAADQTLRILSFLARQRGPVAAAHDSRPPRHPPLERLPPARDARASTASSCTCRRAPLGPRHGRVRTRRRLCAAGAAGAPRPAAARRSRRPRRRERAPRGDDRARCALHRRGARAAPAGARHRRRRSPARAPDRDGARDARRAPPRAGPRAVSGCLGLRRSHRPRPHSARRTARGPPRSRARRGSRPRTARSRSACGRSAPPFSTTRVADRGDRRHLARRRAARCDGARRCDRASGAPSSGRRIGGLAAGDVYPRTMSRGSTSTCSGAASRSRGHDVAGRAHQKVEHRRGDEFGRLLDARDAERLGDRRVVEADHRQFAATGIGGREVRADGERVAHADEGIQVCRALRVLRKRVDMTSRPSARPSTDLESRTGGAGIRHRLAPPALSVIAGAAARRPAEEPDARPCVRQRMTRRGTRARGAVHIDPRVRRAIDVASAPRAAERDERHVAFEQPPGARVAEERSGHRRRRRSRRHRRGRRAARSPLRRCGRCR